MPSFSSPPNQQSYYEEVWMIVRQIPRGKVATYGQIAKMIPLPNGVDIEAYKAFAARWVGGAMANCPDDVPWQRVINSKGEVSERDGADRQRQLLEQEEVKFDAKNRIDLKIFGWSGNQADDMSKQTSLF